MISVLLWIVGCYALAAAAVHAASALTSKRERDERHFVLIAGNEQLQMEWYMRSLRRFSYFTGTEVKVTIVDGGSEDETMGIVRFFARNGMKVDIKSGAPIEASMNRVEDAKQGNVQERKDDLSDQAASESLVSSKWQRFLTGWGRKKWKSVHDKQIGTAEPTHMMWKLQAEGIITRSEHAVLIDLRDPADLSKLPL
ncbi:hypothetical protein Back11_52440 [Paenibacillus baekrokdamisoli]|uniref:Uncharacterized protein n=1 Tax=Paenibacillus baekrokdamisoli TaxID=1712516 RepID=A0A3G9JLI9_9BACL|nr:hypothetical protein [Paenibacillus baekrokdamisoli]MBB3069082.1 hypothetical protein [Paenibacillus baekrokdamisoli]BBH23899.1 hypothetical protein Back11_52440 [Paenibacillus baekrokdamisoli]